MEPQLISKPSFRVLGVQSRIDPLKADYRRIWDEAFGPYQDVIRKQSGAEGYYGVYFSTPTPGEVDFIAGMVAGDVEEVPAGLVVRTIPGGLYAVCECGMAEIGSTWRAIYGDWLPNSEHHTLDRNRPCFEYFPPVLEEGEKSVSIHVPIV